MTLVSVSSRPSGRPANGGPQFGIVSGNIPRSRSDHSNSGMERKDAARRGSDAQGCEEHLRVPATFSDQHLGQLSLSADNTPSRSPKPLSRAKSTYGRVGRASPDVEVNGDCDGGGRGVVRSKSIKAMARRQQQLMEMSPLSRPRGLSIPNEATMPTCGGEATQRTASNRSLPLLEEDSEYLRLRNFSVKSKKVINRGDSFRFKSQSDSNVEENNEAPQGLSASASSDRISPSKEIVSHQDTSPAVPLNHHRPPYKVMVLGASDVGKTSLISQFTTSEYIGDYDTTCEEGTKIVSVVINGEEAELEFVEFSVTEPDMIPPNTDNADAFLMVYSVTNRRSYLRAKQLVSHILDGGMIEEKAVILVGNKTDLARLRAVSIEDGRSLAMSQGCKFIETSVAINHQVDELLVGIMSQIRIRSEHAEKLRKKRNSIIPGKMNGRVTDNSSSKAKGVIKRILKKACQRSKSCHNLHVL